MKPVCVLAFGQPPENWGFVPSRKGTSWWIRIEPARVPRCLAALKELGIKGKALWPNELKSLSPSASTIKPKRQHGRPRGKAGRQAWAEAEQEKRDRRYARHAEKKAEAIAYAAALENAKQARVKRESRKRKVELKKQEAQTLLRDQSQHAMHFAMLLRHTVGNA